MYILLKHMRFASTGFISKSLILQKKNILPGIEFTNVRMKVTYLATTRHHTTRITRIRNNDKIITDDRNTSCATRCWSNIIRVRSLLQRTLSNVVPQQDKEYKNTSIQLSSLNTLQKKAGKNIKHLSYILGSKGPHLLN